MPEAPSPFRLLRPASLSRVLLTCEHATRRLPFATPASRPLRRVLRSHWGWDIGGWDLTRELAARLRATAIGGRFSRLFIDLNRRVDDPTLIRRAVEGVEIPWNRKLAPAAIERRVLEHHVPYHTEVDRLVLRRVIRGVRPLILAVHTFTPQLDGERRDFEVGVLFRDHRLRALRLGRRLAEAGLDVRYNEPYSGIAGLMYAAERHGLHHDLPCLELEVNQELFVRRDAARRLASRIAPALEELVSVPF